MKRTIGILAAMVAAVAMTLAIGSVAFADGGPHGGFGPTTRGTTSAGQGWSSTDGCAGCHRAHTGVNTYLLVTSEQALCESCHKGGVGAGTDVYAGKYVTSSNPAVRESDGTIDAALNGGGFQQAPKWTDGSTTPTLAAMTSKHNVGESGVAWGGGNALGTGATGNTGPGYSGNLECSSCHNPHGNNNYRMLTAGTSWVTNAPRLQDGIVRSNEIDQNVTKNYTIGLDTRYDVGISDFCASCHTNYLWARSGPSTGTIKGEQAYDWDNDGTAEPTWRHSVASTYKYKWDSTNNVWTTEAGHARTHGTLRTGYTYHLRGAVATSSSTFGMPATLSALPASQSAYITCLTCHYAHGTAATSTGFAAPGAGAGGGKVGVVDGSSALLFLDNRGVCQNCHGMGR